MFWQIDFPIFSNIFAQSLIFVRFILIAKLDLFFDDFLRSPNFYMQLELKSGNITDNSDKRNLSTDPFWVVCNPKAFSERFILRFTMPQMKIITLTKKCQLFSCTD